VPSGESAAWCGCFQPLSAAYGSFLPVPCCYLACMLVFVVLSCVAACMYVLSYVTSVRLSSWINEGD